MKCIVFRCHKKSEMYLYVPYQEDEEKIFEQLADGLKKITGKLKRVMALELTPDYKLARVNANEVITEMQKKGFYLQSPPNEVLRKDVSMLHNPSDTF